jgi:hypothetical protein
MAFVTSRPVSTRQRVSLAGWKNDDLPRAERRLSSGIKSYAEER